jgi:hypothetical protein
MLSYTDPDGRICFYPSPRAESTKPGNGETSRPTPILSASAAMRELDLILGFAMDPRH